MLLHPVSEIETLETGSPPSQSAAADWEGPKVPAPGFWKGAGCWSKRGGSSSAGGRAASGCSQTYTVMSFFRTKGASWLGRHLQVLR